MVLVYSDDKRLVFELLNKACELAKELGKKVNAVIIGEDDAKGCISYGADNVIVVETDLKYFKAEEYTDYLCNVIKETGVEIVLIGSNKNGKELASRLAGRLATGCIIDANKVYVKNKKLVTERMVYSGNAIAVQQFNSKPCIITIPSKVFDPLPKDEKRTGEIINK